MTDTPLQQRAGFNTGAEPSNSFFVSKGVQFKIPVSASAVLLRGIEGNIRLANQGSIDGSTWFAFNTTADDYLYDLVWRNTFGETISLLVSPPATVPDTGDAEAGCGLVILEKFDLGYFALAPGETIEAVRAEESETPSATFFPTALDIKTKPVQGGGLSDGNVVIVRATLSLSDFVTIGPPPGKAWTCLPSPKLGRSSAFAAHFGASDDNPCLIEQNLVDADGVARRFDLGGGAETLEPQDIVSVGVGLVGPGDQVLAYPNAWQLKVITDGDDDPPVGRIMLAAAFLEYDLPSDAQTE